MKKNPVAIFAATLLMACIGYFGGKYYDAFQHDKMVVVANQLNQATVEFYSAAIEMKKHPIHAVFFDDLAGALSGYSTRMDYLNTGGCPGDFKDAVANYKVSVAILVEHHKNPQLKNINKAWQILQDAATGMDSVCRKYNLHFENLNTVNFNL